MNRLTTKSFGQVLVIATLLLSIGCEKENPPTPIQTTPQKPTVQPATGQAQPPLKTIQLYLGAAELTAEIADENHERQMGMMHRTTMADKEAMLFVFPRPHRTGFWMKNTIVPLSIAYIDPASRVMEIYDLEPGNTQPVESISARVKYALEVNQGWFKRNGIKAGTVIATDRGSLAVSVKGL